MLTAHVQSQSSQNPGYSSREAGGATNQPPRALLQWLRESGVPARIGGESLKFIRARLPVARLIVDDSDAFEELQARIRAAHTPDDSDNLIVPGLSNVVQAHCGSDEIKLILELPGWGDDFHCLFLRNHHSTQARVRFTIDLLVFDAEREEWVLPDEALLIGDDARHALSDLRAEFLRPLQTPHVSPTGAPDAFRGPNGTGEDTARLNAAEIVRIAVLPALLDFSLDEGLTARLAEDFRRYEAEKLSRKFLHRQFKKLMCGARPSRSFMLMDRAGMLEWFLPELAAGRDLAQNRYHKHDIFYHSIYTCDAVEGPNLALRMAALFHDLGKVDTRRELPTGEATFHNHEMVSTRHAAHIMRRFGFAPDIAKHVRFLVRNHMFHYTDEWTDRAVRRFVNRIAPSMLQDMITLRLADRKGSGKKQALPRAIKDLIRHIERIRAEEAELKIRDLKIDGHALMELGMPPGPRMGQVLQQLLDEVKADRLPNEAQALRERASALLEQNTGTLS